MKLGIEAATKGFRALYALENEIRLIGVVATKLQHDERAENFDMGRVTQVVLPKLEGGFYIYASGDMLRGLSASSKASSITRAT